MEPKNIQVYARVRPFNEKQLINQSSCIQEITLQSIKIKQTSTISTSQTRFTFDQIFSPNSTQIQVYQKVGKNIVATVFQGINGTIFTYGQTSSGKTYTCMGPDIDHQQKKGLIPRIAQEIFNQIASAPDEIEFRIKISIVEIYLEKIRDLLNISKGDLKIRQSKSRGIYIQDVTQSYVSDSAEVIKYIKIGTNNRAEGHTNMNQASSRSHMVFMMTIYQNNIKDLSAKSSKLTLIDLAGSQKVGKTGAEGKLLDEAKNINKSLSALGNVINALTQAKIGHIPYRDSKLTRILQESLGGNAKTNLIINLSPSILNDAQTLSTLRFGYRAKNIKNKPKVNKQYTVAELLLLLQKAEFRIQQQEKIIKEMKINNNNNVYIKSELEIKEITQRQRMKYLQDQIRRYKSESVEEYTSEIGIGTSMIKQPSQDIEKINTLMEDIEEIREEKTELSRNYQILNEKYLKIKSQNSFLHAKISIVQKQNQTFLENQVQLGLENTSLEEKCGELEQKLAVYQQNIQQMAKQEEQFKRKSQKLKLFGSQNMIFNQATSALRKRQAIKKRLNCQEEKSHQSKQVQSLKQEINKLKQQLRIYQHLQEQKEQFVKQKLKYEEQKRKIYSDLQNRVDKVVELEERLDQEKQKNLSLTQIINMDQKPKVKRILNLENYIKQLSTSYYVLKNQQNLWKTDNSIQQNTLKRKNLRINELQKQLGQIKQNLYVLKLKYEQLVESKYLDNDFIDYHVNRKQLKQKNEPRIVKVLRSSSYRVMESNSHQEQKQDYEI